jgi:hypothetical protein
MKLLNCLACRDVVLIRVDVERSCRCGRSHGRYEPGGVVARYSGHARILGMRNLDYERAKPGESYPWFVVPEGHHVEREGPDRPHLVKPDGSGQSGNE